VTVTESSLNELELLSNKSLVAEALQLFINTYIELSRRREVTKDFLRDLCSFSVEAQVWYILWESGGSQRFTDILLLVGCSRSKLSDVLRELLRVGLVRMVEKRYQAVSPAWLVCIREPNKQKP